MTEANSCQGPIPFDFGEEPHDTAGVYARLRYARAYIRHCAKRSGLYGRRVGDKRLLHDALAALRPKRMAKFERERQSWNEGEPPIPTAYLRYIGVDMDLLRAAIEIDAHEWSDSMLRAPTPQFFTIRGLPPARAYRPLKSGLSAEEAVNGVRVFLNEHSEFQSCRIRWPGLQTIEIERDKPPMYRYYRPVMMVVGSFVRFEYSESIAGGVLGWRNAC